MAATSQPGRPDAAPAGRTSRLRALADRHALSGAIVAGGALGALARLALDELMPVEPGRWPWSTLTANLIGCALLGYVATRLLERLPPSAYRRPLLGTGLCGALTTFSSLQVEALALGRDGHGTLALGYVATSLVAGLLLVTVTTALVRRARLGVG
jgi:fluoride exporter